MTNINLSTPTFPTLPKLGKGTEFVQLLLKQVSNDMREPLVPMIFPILGAHISGTEFQYPDNTWKEPCGMMANLVADSGCNKGQLTHIVEALCRDFRLHDSEELERLVAWQKQMKTRSANKEKPDRPGVTFRFLPADVTNAAFLQNAMACEIQGGVTQYLNLPEVEMADSICGGHKKISKLLRNLYDRQRDGALRATADGVTGNPILRANLTLSSTPYSTRKFYKSEIHNGTFGRMVFSYKARTDRNGRIPRLGRLTDEFYYKVDDYLQLLTDCRGRFSIKPLNKLADQMAEDMAQIADLADDDMLWDISKRAIVSAWKAGCILWVLNGQTWSRSIGDLVEWLAYHDIWSKLQIFSDMLTNKEGEQDEKSRCVPKNMLDELSDTFNEAQLKALRLKMGKSESGTGSQLRKWVFLKLIIRDTETGLYSKTEHYFKRFK